MNNTIKSGNAPLTLQEELKEFAHRLDDDQELQQAALHIYEFACKVNAFLDNNGHIHITSDRPDAAPLLKSFRYVRDLASYAGSHRNFRMSARLYSLMRTAMFHGYDIPQQG